MKLIRSSLAVVLFAVCCSAVCQAAKDERADIQQMMSPEQFQAAGLNKLSPEELKNLNRFLNGYRESTLQGAQKEAAIEKLDLIISRVDGAFEGLKGRTIIRLVDGSSWKQINPEDHFRGRPGNNNLAVAVVKRGLFGYEMRIEGVPRFS